MDNLLKISLILRNLDFSRYWLYMNTNIYRDFHICISVLLIENFIFCAVRIWGTGLEKLLSTKLFFAQHHLVFADMKHLFVLHQLFFVDMKQFFVIFVGTRLLLVQHQTHKTVFRATPNFCFGHCLGYYVILICFCCHVATKI